MEDSAKAEAILAENKKAFNDRMARETGELRKRQEAFAKLHAEKMAEITDGEARLDDLGKDVSKRQRAVLRRERSLAEQQDEARVIKETAEAKLAAMQAALH